MRELKFRCWGIKENKYLKLHSIHLSTSKVIVSYYGVGGGNVSEALKDVMLEQYTGLKDKNGKEIYEGDILDDGFSHIGKVFFNQIISAFVFEFVVDDNIVGSTFVDMYTRDIEVIGNIHENPELLGGEE